MRTGVHPSITRFRPFRERIGVARIGPAHQHVTEAHFVLGRVLVVHPGVRPFHRVLVAAHRIGILGVHMARHACPLTAALAQDTHLPVVIDRDHLGILGHGLGRGRERELDHLLIAHLMFLSVCATVRQQGGERRHHGKAHERPPIHTSGEPRSEIERCNGGRPVTHDQRQ